MSYIFGGDTDTSYEQLQQRRRMVERLRKQNSNQTPRNVGEGIHAITRALVARGVDRQNAEREAKMQADLNASLQGIFSGWGGGASSGNAAYSASGGSYTPSEPDMVDQLGLDMGRTGDGPERNTIEVPFAPVDPSYDDATWGALASGAGGLDMGRETPQSPGERLMIDLQRDLDLTKEQAAGIVGNLAHESGDFKTLQEINPLVEGSRGGYGYAQWTGPRRRAFEEWSQSQGLDPSSYKANYGFLLHELQNTPEGRVLGELRQAQDPIQAARIFSERFLRPGIPHMDSRLQRAAAFAGGEYTPSQPPAAGAGVRVADSGGFSPDLMKMISVMNHPMLPEGQKAVIGAMVEQRLQQMQPRQPEYQFIDGVGMVDMANPPPEMMAGQYDGGMVESNPQVQSSEILHDGTVVTVLKNGSTQVTDASGTLLEGAARAKAIEDARNKRAETERSVYRARGIGGNQADIELGGQAAAAKSIGGTQGDFVKSAFESADAVAGSIGNINTAIAALDAGARSGAIDRYIPNITEASATLQNAMDRMGLDVIGSVTFGALSEAELRLAMETAVPRNLDEPQLRAWLEKKRNAQQKVRVALLEQAQFLSDPNNSLSDWAEKLGQKVSNDEAGAKEAPKRLRFNTETGKLE